MGRSPDIPNVSYLCSGRYVIKINILPGKEGGFYWEIKRTSNLMLKTCYQGWGASPLANNYVLYLLRYQIPSLVRGKTGKCLF